MGISVNAVYEDGVLTLEHPVELPAKSRVHVVIDAADRPAPTPLGTRLRDLRAQVVASGEPLLDWDQIADEVAKRRGGFREDG